MCMVAAEITERLDGTLIQSNRLCSMEDAGILFQNDFGFGLELLIGSSGTFAHAKLAWREHRTPYYLINIVHLWLPAW